MAEGTPARPDLLDLLDLMSIRTRLARPASQEEPSAPPSPLDSFVEARLAAAPPFEPQPPQPEIPPETEVVAGEEEPAGAELLEPADEGEAEELEGPGEDFQALLGGAELDEIDQEQVPPLPVDGEVKLTAPDGVEFSGRSTLAGASGIYCLVERFDLPAGSRVSVVLMAPSFSDTIEIPDAIISRVRRAPGDAAEVQLAFESRHDELEEFVARHFGDKPGFSLFRRGRGKRQ